MAKWPPTENQPRPAGIKDFWQAELNKLLGLNPFGGPMLKLVWMQEELNFYREQLLRKYVCCRSKLTGEIIAPPRWGVEQWIGPKLASQDWNKHATEMMYDSTKGIFRRVDILGEVPSRGLYAEAFWIIAEHDRRMEEFDGKLRNVCCIGRRKQGLRCYGLIGADREDLGYRAPDDRDMSVLAIVTAVMKNKPQTYGYDEMPTTEQIAQAVRDAYYADEKNQEAKDRKFAEMADDKLTPHVKRILNTLHNTGSGLDNVQYKDVGPALSKLRETANDPTAYPGPDPI